MALLILSLTSSMSSQHDVMSGMDGNGAIHAVSSVVSMYSLCPRWTSQLYMGWQKPSLHSLLRTASHSSTSLASGTVSGCPHRTHPLSRKTMAHLPRRATVHASVWWWPGRARTSRMYVSTFSETLSSH